MIIKTLNKALCECICIYIRGSLIGLSRSLKAGDYFFYYCHTAYTHRLLTAFWWPISDWAEPSDEWLLRWWPLMQIANVSTCGICLLVCVHVHTLNQFAMPLMMSTHNFFIFLFNFMHMLCFVHFHISRDWNFKAKFCCKRLKWNAQFALR